jgi:hypothetical protein
MLYKPIHLIFCQVDIGPRIQLSDFIVLALIIL